MEMQAIPPVQNGYRRLLDVNGYTVVPDVLDDALLARARKEFSPDKMAEAPAENYGSAGAFIVSDYRNEAAIELLTYPKMHDTLKKLGFAAVKLHNFYVSTKPPGSAALPWHSDLFYHYEQAEPAELFLIQYLQDTTPQNGCLRVVPGSHRWPHEERQVPINHGEERAGEVAVPIRGGDLFIGDRRVLHATYANHSPAWRTCITIAVAPMFATLPDEVRTLIINNQTLPPAGWWRDPVANIDPRLRPFLPVYDVR